MFRDAMRKSLPMLLAGGLAAAGCVGTGGALRDAPGFVSLPAADAPDAAGAASLQLGAGVHGTIGVEAGRCYLRPEEWNDKFGHAPYCGVRYDRMLGLNWGLSFAAGCISAPAKDPSDDDLEIYVARGTLEVGSYLGTTLCRWYIGAGGGRTFTDERDLIPLGLVLLDDEWSTHAVLGVEFRNEGIISTRLEGSHVWFRDSGADHWAGTVALAFQF